MSLYEMFQQRWTDRKKTAIIFGEERWTWADLDHRVRQAYRWLDRLGTQPEDVLALQLPKCIDQQALMLAALARGLITLPLNPSYTTRECQRALTDSRSKVAVLLAENTALSLQDGLVFSADTLAAELDSSTPAVTLNQPPMDSVGFLCYTSGTTGPPKGALITQGNVLHTLQALHKIWHWSAADHLVHVLPLFHIHGLFAAQFGAYLAGATTEWFDKFEPNQVLAALSRVSSGVFMGVPTHYHRFVSPPEVHDFDLSGVRLFTSGSAPLPTAIHQRFHAQFGHQILERYGMTEIGIALSNPYEGARKAGTVGHPLPGIEVRIASADGTPVHRGETGELEVRGPSVMTGYLRRPQATEEALGTGWMRTGDLARQDEDGYFCIVGRNKDMIISGGLNVYPREVETALLSNASIASAAVIGLPDPDLGERVVAAITTSCETLDLAAVQVFLREQLAPYKCPKAVKVVHQLPRNTVGKVQKSQLRALWPLYGSSDWDPDIQSALRTLIVSAQHEPHPPLAVFDFDNTCIAGDIGEAVLLALADQRGADYLSPYQELCESVGIVEGYTWCAERCEGFTPDEIRQIAAREFARALEEGRISLRPGICDLISTLQKSNWEVWIVTASAQVIVEGISIHVGVPSDHVIGMTLEIDPTTGLLCPNAIPPVTVYEGKLEAVHQVLGRSPQLAAGDSDTDFHMIEGAELGIVIDRGQPNLRQLANRDSVWIQRGWKTHSMESSSD